MRKLARNPIFIIMLAVAGGVFMANNAMAQPMEDCPMQANCGNCAVTVSQEIPEVKLHNPPGDAIFIRLPYFDFDRAERVYHPPRF